MDYPALQARLRSFAAARDWQSRHTPKNLAMALTVEAAGLLELFQWTTLSESRGVARDPAYKERVTHGIADVLLCLVQLADQAGVDLPEAVEHTLRAKVLEHPPKHPELELPTPAAAVAAMPAPTAPRVHLLVDWENVQPKGDELQALVPQGTHVWLFHGPHQTVDASGHRQVYGAEQVTLVQRTGTGKNALDFQLTYYVGYISANISARQSEGTFVVVSNDQGYEPMLAHARELGFDAQQRGFRRVQAPLAAPAVFEAPVAQKSEPLPIPSPQPEPPLTTTPAVDAKVQAAAKTVVPRPATAKAVPTRTQATRADMLQLLDQLDDLPPPHRPAQKDALLVLLQNWLGESSARSPRTSHALAQLQARKRVVVKGEAVSYPPVAVAPLSVKKPAPKSTAKAAPSKAVTAKAAAAKKASAPKAPAPPSALKKSAVSASPPPPIPVVGKTSVKVAQPPTAAQVARAVLSSLQKMTTNKPRQRAGLLKHIQTHAARAEDPAAMAQRVLSLLEARKDVFTASDGKRITYLKV
jgi:NTP pyrophosphatase (non-canonical NTP hydrolase)